MIVEYLCSIALIIASPVVWALVAEAEGAPHETAEGAADAVKPPPE